VLKLTTTRHVIRDNACFDPYIRMQHQFVYVTDSI